MPFDTPLHPAQEGDFLKWKAEHAPYDSGHDYDLRGAFQSGVTPDPQTGHWPDTFKKPNHPTFSDQSIYSSLAGTKPGSWQGEKYTPFQEKQAGMGYNQHPFWKALEGVVNSIRAPQLSSNKQPWGFHEPTLTAGEAVGPVASAAGDVMTDPRNAWMGMGPMAGMAAMGKGVRKLANGWNDLGGFNVSTRAMRHDMNMPRPNLRQGDIPGGTEQGVRADFLSTTKDMNEIGRQIAEGNQFATDMVANAPPDIRSVIAATMKGHAQLKDEIARRKNSVSGGATLPSFLDPRNRYGR